MLFFLSCFWLASETQRIGFLGRLVSHVMSVIVFLITIMTS